MRFYKLRVTTNAAAVASQFNEQFRPETIPEANDPFRVDWITAPIQDAYVVGDRVRLSIAPSLFPRETDWRIQVLRLADPAEQGYVLRWPMHSGNFNTRDYSSNQEILSDVETIISATLEEKFGIEPKSLKVRTTPTLSWRAFSLCRSGLLSCSRNSRLL